MADLVDFVELVFSHPTLIGGIEIALKTTVVYLFLVFGLRLSGKRELGQMNIYDVVLVMVLANAVQNAMVGEDTTLVGGIIAGSTLLGLNRLVTVLMIRSKSIAHLLVGEPVLLVREGKLLIERMRAEGITKEQLLEALREHGLQKVGDAQIAVLEVDGSISIVPHSSPVRRSRRHFKALRIP